MEPRLVPGGSEVTLGPPSFPAADPLLSALRRFVRAEAGVVAVYGFSLGIGREPAGDVLGVERAPRGPGAVSGDDEHPLLDRLAAALEPVAPRETHIDLTVLSDTARLDVLRVVAPVGAGGLLEEAAARAAHDSSGVADLARRLLEATLYVPALGGDERGNPEPRELRPGEAVRYPVVRFGAHDTIAVFSSWPALLHADPPFPDQVALRGEAMLAAWPAGVGLALDPGCVHAAVLPPDQCAALRAAVVA